MCWVNVGRGGAQEGMWLVFPKTSCSEECFTALQKRRLIDVQDEWLCLNCAPRGPISYFFFACFSVSRLSSLQLMRHLQLLSPRSLPSALPAPFPSWAGAQPEHRHNERSCPSLLSRWESSARPCCCSPAGRGRDWALSSPSCAASPGCRGNQLPLPWTSQRTKESNPELPGELHRLFDIYLLPGSLEEKFPRVHWGFCGHVFAVASWCID